jgi:hypothetical protein
MIDLNYVIGAAGQVTVSATGSTLQSATITTSGFPVQISVTGDAEPNGAGWHRLQIYRDSTPIGEVLHIETTLSGSNMTVSMLTIDTPVSGTYTYSVKLVANSGISARYTEMGQLSMIVEEKVISSHNALSWIRRDISGSNVYYGYSSDMNAADTDNNWSIKKITTSGSVETVKWTNGSYGYDSKWSERVASFATPTGSLGLTCSVNTPILNINWSQLSGVDKYRLSIVESGKLLSEIGAQIYNNSSAQFTKELINTGSYNFNAASRGLTYSITVTAVNVIGSSASTITVTT